MQRKYLSHLNNWFNSETRRPLIVRGARQVGKSTLVRKFAQMKGLKLHEINLERHQNLESDFRTLNMKSITAALDAATHGNIHSANSLLFLDEIQATPSALAALRYFHEDYPDTRVIAAGSLLEFTLETHSFSMPVGRIEYLYLEPMSFGEYLLNLPDPWLFEKWQTYQLNDPWPVNLHEQYLQHLRTYMMTGGMPVGLEAFFRERPLATVFKLMDGISTTYQDDFSKYSSRAYAPRVRQCFDKMPLRVGKKIKYVEIDPLEKAAIVKTSLELLISAGLLRRTYMSDGQGTPLRAQVHEKIFKCYWLDVGLLNRILGTSFKKLEDHQYHEGQMAEQFVAQHLSSQQPWHLKPELFYWLRDGQSHNAEVDFLMEHQGSVIPIEVKSNATGHLKSLHSFFESHGSECGVRLSAQEPGILDFPAKNRYNARTKLINLPLYFTERIKEIISS